MPDGPTEANAKALAAELGVDYTPAAGEVDAARRRAIARAQVLAAGSRPTAAGAKIGARLGATIAAGENITAVCPRCGTVVPAPDGATAIVLAEWGTGGVTLTDSEGRYWPKAHKCTRRARRRWARSHPFTAALERVLHRHRRAR